jgi:hypothetical protein
MQQSSSNDIAVRSAFDEYCAGLELPEFAVPFEASPAYPVVQYSKGVLVVSGRKDMKYTGWHIAIEQSAELDGYFDKMGIPVVRVRHMNGSEGSYWQLDSITGYLLMKSVPLDHGADSWKQSGIACVWNDCKGTYVHGSQLQCLFFLKGLMDLGYTQPLTLTFSRTVTGQFISGVLRRQEALLDAITRALAKHGRVASLASYAYWVELLPSQEEFTTKKGASYFPPSTTIELTPDYVRTHQADPTHIATIEEFLPSWDGWCESASKMLLEPPRDNNRDAEAEATEPPKEAKLPDEKAAPPRDETITASNDALYRSALREKRRAMDARIIVDDYDWFSLLEICGFVEFKDPQDIVKLHKAIKARMAEQSAS